MTTATQTRLHSGHSHSHHHHHDNTYLISANKKDAGVRITRIGLYVNLGMAISKGIGGWFFSSHALSADAVHSLTDLVSDFMTLATVSWSLKPATAQFPSGYGKVESLGSLGVSAMLLGTGVMMSLNACGLLYHEFFMDAAAHGWWFGHGHSHSHTSMGPNINAAWIAAGSIVVKEYLYRASMCYIHVEALFIYLQIYIAMKIATDRKSSVLASNAVHHRIDSLTSIVALVAIGGSNFLHNAAWLDPVGSLIVSLMIIQAGWGNTWSALLELADVGVDEEMRNLVRASATKALTSNETILSSANQVEVSDVQGVKAGQNYLMDLVLAVPGELSVDQLRPIEAAVRERVGSKVRGVRKLRIRFISKGGEKADFADEFIGGEMSLRTSPEPEDEKDATLEPEQSTTNGSLKKVR